MSMPQTPLASAEVTLRALDILLAWDDGTRTGKSGPPAAALVWQGQGVPCWPRIAAARRAQWGSLAPEMPPGGRAWWQCRLLLPLHG